MTVATIPKVPVKRSRKKTVPLVQKSGRFNTSNGLYWFDEIVELTGFNPDLDKGPEIPEFIPFAEELIDEHCPAIPTLHDMVTQLTGRTDVTNVLYEVKDLEAFLASMDESKAANTDKVSADAKVDVETSQRDGS